MPVAKSASLFVVVVYLATSLSVSAQADQLSHSLRLSKADKRSLDSSVPSQVRNFLESADSLKVFAQMLVEDGKLQPAMDRDFVPSFEAVVSNRAMRSTLLKAFYFEASKGESPAICYLPSHAIVAEEKGRKVIIEICFGCNRFYISGALGTFKGTFTRKSSETERLISTIVTDLGVTTKQVWPKNS